MVISLCPVYAVYSYFKAVGFSIMLGGLHAGCITKLKWSYHLLKTSLTLKSTNKFAVCAMQPLHLHVVTYLNTLDKVDVVLKVFVDKA